MGPVFNHFPALAQSNLARVFPPSSPLFLRWHFNIFLDIFLQSLLSEYSLLSDYYVICVICVAWVRKASSVISSCEFGFSYWTRKLYYHYQILNQNSTCIACHPHRVCVPSKYYKTVQTLTMHLKSNQHVLNKQKAIEGIRRSAGEGERGQWEHLHFCTTPKKFQHIFNGRIFTPETANEMLCVKIPPPHNSGPRIWLTLANSLLTLAKAAGWTCWAVVPPNSSMTKLNKSRDHAELWFFWCWGKDCLLGAS